MTQSVNDRNTRQRPGALRNVPLAANARIPAGVIAQVTAAGLLVNGSALPNVACAGVTQAACDNSGGADGARSADVAVGVFGPFGNSGGADQLSKADIGKACYVVDNSTVAKTDGSGARSAAGKVFDVDAEGVWVEFH